MRTGGAEGLQRKAIEGGKNKSSKRGSSIGGSAYVERMSSMFFLKAPLLALTVSSADCPR